MLELLDLDRQIPKELYNRTFPAMKTHLGELQRGQAIGSARGDCL